MDPLTPPAAVSAAMLDGLQKHSENSDPVLRRKRPPAPRRAVEENETELDTDTPKHALDDLA
jgi:hypothetical protein